jgi:hypothetical protein
MIDRLTPKKAFAFGAAALILVLLAGWFLFLSPKVSEAGALEDRIAEAETKLIVAEALGRDGAQRESEAELARLTKAVPQEIEMSGILRELAAAATTARVRVTGVTPAAPVPQTGYQAMPMTIALEGRYFPITKFLQLLRKRADLVGESEIRADGRLYSVDSVTFGTAVGGVIQATTTVNAFYFGAPVATADGTATTGAAATATATAAPTP